MEEIMRDQRNCRKGSSTDHTRLTK
jgi:hypothetical protein